jgi:hypothetical protein
MSTTIASNSIKTQSVEHITTSSPLNIGLTQVSGGIIVIGSYDNGGVTNLSSEVTRINGGSFYTNNVTNDNNIIIYPKDTFILQIGSTDGANVGSAISIGREGSIFATVPRSTTTLRGVVNLSNGLGSAGQVLTSGGSTGSLTWTTVSGGGSTIVNGKIASPTYSATTPTLYSFPTPFTGAIPNVVLTVDNGSSTSPTIIIAGLASISLSGFYYLLSGTPPAGATLNWFATQ